MEKRKPGRPPAADPRVRVSFRISGPVARALSKVPLGKRSAIVEAALRGVLRVVVVIAICVALAASQVGCVTTLAGLAVEGVATIAMDMLMHVGDPSGPLPEPTPELSPRVQKALDDLQPKRR
jgi:hypothetical protein